MLCDKQYKKNNKTERSRKQHQIAHKGLVRNRQGRSNGNTGADIHVGRLLTLQTDLSIAYEPLDAVMGDRNKGVLIRPVLHALESGRIVLLPDKILRVDA